MAVYTELSHDEIQAFLLAYDLPQLDAAEGIRSGLQNTNYFLYMKDGSRYIFTLFEKWVDKADLPFFTGLMDRLAIHNIPCPKVIHAEDGSAIQYVKAKSAVLVTFLKGQSVTVIRNTHMSELGAAMAKMHIAGVGFEKSRANALTLEGWKNILTKIIGRADEIVPGLSQELEKEMGVLEAAWPRDLPVGIIHADLFPDNVFFNEADKLTGIIDLYFACNDFLAYELAICLNAWSFEKTFDFNITKAKLMLRAYNEIRSISEAELEALPILARGAAFRFLLTRAQDWLFPAEGALVTPKDPMEYLKKLRFHQTVTHHKEYGL